MESLTYFYDRYIIVGEGQLFPILSAVIAAILFTISMYLFTKNKWGSILISPFATVFLTTFSLNYQPHLYFILFSFIISFIVIQRLDSKMMYDEN
ncbi:hypothetical protein [Bacillus sp. AFS041924]|uniref:hypothetical protein n=1 Tax=Bacillus sp. AFS041924 TaxID=2033503 RepID=UPI000BFC8422|nr:hypothetical protein [Bacillus sp. AFS041924]PGS50610.1 hypothetical protein COC46_12730 [Bacillus sp. AFS041924]